MKKFQDLYTCGGVNGTERCCFFDAFPMPEGRGYQHEAGMCRRAAPILDLRGSQPKTMFPRVIASGWCGDHGTMGVPDG